MNTHVFLNSLNARSAGALASLALISSCALTPENDSLAEAREQVEQAQQTPAVTEHAALTLEQAEESLATAESLWDEEGRDEQEAVEHHAYLAERQATVAIQRAAQGEAQKEVEQASRTREQVVRRARERELQAARDRAEQAEMEAESAQQQARTREEQYQSARDQAASAQAQTEAERQQELQELRETVESLQAQQTERGMVLTMKDVLFDFGQSEMNPGGARTMEQLASYLERNPDRQILVEGYTDNIGDPEFNRELARQRAEAVREQLAAAGIDTNRIQVEAHGEEYPIATNETAAGRQLNRRVEVVVANAGKGTPEPRDESGDQAPEATETGSPAAENGNSEPATPQENN